MITFQNIVFEAQCFLFHGKVMFRSADIQLLYSKISNHSIKVEKSDVIRVSV